MGSFLSMGEQLSFSWTFLELRKNYKPDTTSCPSWFWVCFLFPRTDGSMVFQWPRMDRELFWLLTIGWILEFFTPFCTETCGSRGCPGKTYRSRWVIEAWEEKKVWTLWAITGLIPQASSLDNALTAFCILPTHRGYHFQPFPSSVMCWAAWLSEWLG